jgi:4-diphosphocytidyl-2-C-methyl-D-erythritol kinase
MATPPPPDRVVRVCPAKVNLHLSVLGRRPDGYHDLETIMAEIDLHDDLVVERIPAGIELVVEGDRTVPDGPENLVHRAAAAVLAPGEGVRIRLTKRIPCGAGLGGGSSDAAATLMALDEMFGLRDRGVDLEGAAAALGSDVAFFLHGGVAVCRGRGERVEPVTGVQPFELTLFLSDLHVPTKQVYGTLEMPLTPREEGITLCLDALRAGKPGRMVGAARNDLEGPAFSLFDGLRQLRDVLVDVGVGGVRLSGSGSALFAMADPTPEQLRRIVAARPDVRALRVGVGQLRTAS